MMTTRQIRRIGQKRKPKPQYHKPEYSPTPEQIAAGCAQIQAEWSDVERLRRGRGGARAFDVENGVRMGRISECEIGELV